MAIEELYSMPRDPPSKTGSAICLSFNNRKKTLKINFYNNNNEIVYMNRS